MPNPDPRESTRDTHFTVSYSVESGGKKKEEVVKDGPLEDEEVPAEGEEKPFPPKPEGDEEEGPPKKDKPEAVEEEAPQEDEQPQPAEEDEEEDDPKGKKPPFPPKKRSAQSLTDIYRAASAPVEVRNEDGDTLHGYFSVFGNPYRISSFWEGDFYEKVEPGAFARAIKERGNSIRVLLEHGFDPQVGNKTLGKMQKISEDSRGGTYEAKLYTEASYVKDLLPGLRNGDYEASFRFRVREDHWDYDPERTDWNPEGLPVRTLKDVDVLEVGPCLFGANPEATSGVRSMTDRYTQELAHARGAESMHDKDDNASRKVEATPLSVSAKKAAEKPEEVRQEKSDVTDTNANKEGRARMPKSLNERRADLAAMVARRDAISEAAGEYELTAEARSEYDKLGQDMAALKASIEFDEKRLDEVKTRHAQGRVEGGARVVSQPETYRKGGNQSYFKDLYRATYTADTEARERLVRNNAEARAGMTTTDGAGGEFVPPLWMVNEFIDLAKAGRVVADQMNKQPLPAGTDSISLPTVTGGPSIAEHTTQNAAASETDMTTSSVSAAVTTEAGLQTVSLQLLEQSPLNVDTVVFPELAKEYAVKLDTFVLNNNATDKKGILQTASINTVTYTDASPTVGDIYPKLADAIQKIHTTRYDAPSRIFMHPRRYAWFRAALDSSNRPLVLPVENSPQNVISLAQGNAAEGLVGSLFGLPVYIDPNIPTNLGAGTNEDIIVVMKADDAWLFEGTPRAEVSREAKFGNLSALFRFYNYIAFTAARFPKSICTVGGTGLVSPSF